MGALTRNAAAEKLDKDVQQLEKAGGLTLAVSRQTDVDLSRRFCHLFCDMIYVKFIYSPLQISKGFPCVRNYVDHRWTHLSWKNEFGSKCFLLFFFHSLQLSADDYVLSLF